ncbi:piRNA biogenesis protein EXD1 [Zootermopsis nevadensis]|uniref:Exonuclease 3'-5' domain-containing protein 1 n=1 Tax=Zootermopsis nevadensis TaxID=136037 RepID=A0A067QUM6_ZOONE|nr:piRNA biogenesis protein EXD1 [Zootermopsis nevadensis]KDR13862.1 Exonuclease 3'-5' domain-containing protein 1 [Zootermopsis nevadensis]
MDEDYSKGQRLFIETVTGTVEGVFHSKDPGHNKLTLNKVILHPSGRKIQGLYHYYRNEIISVRVLEPGSYPGVNKENEAAGNWNLMRKVQPPVHADKVPGKVTSSDVVMNSRPGYGHSRKAAMNRRKLSAEEYDTMNKLVQNHVLIDRMGDVFKKAVRDIKAEATVGLSVEGTMFGRCSKLSLISIATPSHAFLFDIFTIGDAAFDNGLRDILEAKDIEKVIHNCRLVSDCLHHQHHVTICSIFDTQVADLMVTQQQYGQFPRTVCSLPQCLTQYLHLPNNLLYYPKIREGYILLDSLQWNKRPLPIELISAAVKNSVFLVQLRNKMCDEMMKPFRQCVNVFLSVVRDADPQEASEHQASDALVPLELLALNDQPRKAVEDQKTPQDSVSDQAAS